MAFGSGSMYKNTFKKVINFKRNGKKARSGSVYRVYAGSETVKDTGNTGTDPKHWSMVIIHKLQTYVLLYHKIGVL